MLKRWIVASAAVSLIACLTTPAAISGASRFRARLDLVQVSKTVDVARCGAEPRVLIGLEGEGRITGIGRVTADGSHCTIDDPASVPFDGGILVVSATEGDIIINYSGTDTAGTLEGTFTIVGGTGAFEGASGGGTLSGSADPGDERGRVILDGWID